MSEADRQLLARLEKEHADKQWHRRVRNSARFTKVPYSWERALASARAGVCVYRVALHLLYHAEWKADRTVKLTNVAMKAAGVSRKGKDAALRLLVRLGLVTVQGRHKKSPLVTVIYPT
jgi:hypothetical protein